MALIPSIFESAFIYATVLEKVIRTSVNDGPVGCGGRADITLPDAFDGGQRIDAGPKHGAVGFGQFGFQPKVDGVNKHKLVVGG